MRLSERTAGMISVICAAMMWAIEPVVARYAYKSSGFLETTTVRAMVAALLAFLHLAVKGRLGDLRIEKSHMPKLIFIGVVGTATASLLYFYSFTKIPVLNSVLIAHMQPIFIILIGFVMFAEERLTKRDFLFIISMVTAGILVTTKNVENFKTLKLGTYGDLMVLIATLAWAVSGIVAKKYLTTLPTSTLVFYRFLTASVALGLVSLRFGDLRCLNLYQVVNGLIIFVGISLYYEGLKRLKTAITSSFELTSPIFASVLGYVFFRESVTVMQVAGLVLILVAVVFIRHSE